MKENMTFHREFQVVYCPACNTPKYFDADAVLPTFTDCVNAGLMRIIDGMKTKPVMPCPITYPVTNVEIVRLLPNWAQVPEPGTFKDMSPEDAIVPLQTAPNQVQLPQA